MFLSRMSGLESGRPRLPGAGLHAGAEVDNAEHEGPDFRLGPHTEEGRGPGVRPRGHTDVTESKGGVGGF